MKIIKKTSRDWIQILCQPNNIRIINVDGWRGNLHEALLEHITATEFLKRLTHSHIKVHYKTLMKMIDESEDYLTE